MVKIIVIFFALIMLPILATLGSYKWSEYTCSKRWSSFQVRYGWIEDCQLLIDGKWIPEDRYQYRKMEE